MMSDPLSDVLDLVETQGVMSSAIAADGAWYARGSVVEHPLKFVAVARGSVRLTTDDGNGPLTLGPGEVAILNNRSWMEVRGGDDTEPAREIDVTGPGRTSAHQGGADMVLGGHIVLNPIGRSLLLPALPPVGHVRAGSTDAPLRARLDQLLDEVSGDRIGSAFAVRQLGQLLVLDLLRAHLGRAELHPGWLRLLTNEQLRPAVALMHADPGATWRLETLAQAAAMSRTSFATRFRAVADMPPLAYLSRWRMLLAQRALRTGDDHVGALASALGYASESAFSTAFTREVGESPLRYRKRVREEADRPGQGRRPQGRHASSRLAPRVTPRPERPDKQPPGR
ncbi:AraC family transcriptional regulator [Streptomyces sp. P38-E01]|uniref:AraC family transcriptional regulator n=1 Tax=Streptomyces tardus TaxID=2780544 RepID=A0A949N4I8_9ACTN|nr:AraC family transcriptional regulator [Streptomyces tardus]